MLDDANVDDWKASQSQVCILRSDDLILDEKPIAFAWNLDVAPPGEQWCMGDEGLRAMRAAIQWRQIDADETAQLHATMKEMLNKTSLLTGSRVSTGTEAVTNQQLIDAITSLRAAVERLSAKEDAEASTAATAVSAKSETVADFGALRETLLESSKLQHETTCSRLARLEEAVEQLSGRLSDMFEHACQAEMKLAGQLRESTEAVTATLMHEDLPQQRRSDQQGDGALTSDADATEASAIRSVLQSHGATLEIMLTELKRSAELQESSHQLTEAFTSLHRERLASQSSELADASREMRNCIGKLDAVTLSLSHRPVPTPAAQTETQRGGDPHLNHDEAAVVASSMVLKSIADLEQRLDTVLQSTQQELLELWSFRAGPSLAESDDCAAVETPNYHPNQELLEIESRIQDLTADLKTETMAAANSVLASMGQQAEAQRQAMQASLDDLAQSVTASVSDVRVFFAEEVELWKMEALKLREMLDGAYRNAQDWRSASEQAQAVSQVLVRTSQDAIEQVTQLHQSLDDVTRE